MTIFFPIEKLFSLGDVFSDVFFFREKHSISTESRQLL